MRDGGTWERWLTFFLHGVVEVSAQATDTVRRILALRETHRRAITDTFGRAARQATACWTISTNDQLSR